MRFGTMAWRPLYAGVRIFQDPDKQVPLYTVWLRCIIYYEYIFWLLFNVSITNAYYPVIVYSDYIYS